MKKPDNIFPYFLCSVFVALILHMTTLAPRAFAQSASSIYMPMLMREKTGSITGRIEVSGAPAVNVSVDLINEHYQVVGTAKTDSSGRYEFISPPGLSPGQTYQVDYEDFEQDVDTSGWLYAFTTQKVTLYEKGAELQLPAFDIADIVMLTPAEFAQVELPHKFTWQRRAVSRPENYFLRIICNTLTWEFRNLGYTSEVTISGDDQGLYEENANCYWDMGVVARFGEGYNSELRFINFIEPQ